MATPTAQQAATAPLVQQFGLQTENETPIYQGEAPIADPQGTYQAANHPWRAGLKSAALGAMLGIPLGPAGMLGGALGLGVLGGMKNHKSAQMGQANANWVNQQQQQTAQRFNATRAGVQQSYMPNALDKAGIAQDTPLAEALSSVSGPQPGEDLATYQERVKAEAAHILTQYQNLSQIPTYSRGRGELPAPGGPAADKPVQKQVVNGVTQLTAGTGYNAPPELPNLPQRRIEDLLQMTNGQYIPIQNLKDIDDTLNKNTEASNKAKTAEQTYNHNKVMYPQQERKAGADAASAATRAEYGKRQAEAQLKLTNARTTQALRPPRQPAARGQNSADRRDAAIRDMYKAEYPNAPPDAIRRLYDTHIATGVRYKLVVSKKDPTSWTLLPDPVSKTPPKGKNGLSFGYKPNEVARSRR